VSETKPGTALDNEHPILSRRYEERQLMVVADDVVRRAESLVLQVGATTSRGGAASSPEYADRKANKIILGMILQMAAAAVIPVAVNWGLLAALLGIGVVRIGRTYGVPLNRKEGWKLVVQFFRAAGIFFVSAYVSSKVVVALIQSTGIGYLGGVTLDVVVSVALAVAIGATAKAYFQGERRESELGKIMRRTFKKGRRQFSVEWLRRMREQNKAALFDYEKLRELLASEAGRDVVLRLLLENPGEAAQLSAFMSRQGLTKLQDLSVTHLKALDEETGGAREFWDLVTQQIDIHDTMEASRIDAVPSGARPAPIQLWVEDVSLLVVPFRDTEDLTFPFGHPRDEVLYVGHPAIAQVYYPAAEFHRSVFENKFSESVRILRFLGATQLRVEHVEGRSGEWASKLYVGLEGAKVGGEIGGTQQSQASILYEARFSGTKDPALPSDLVWYDHEPTWQEIAEGRLMHNLQDFRLNVEYTGDFGINLDLVSKLAGIQVGLDLGGKFEDHKSTVWRIMGTFSNSPQ
jgi:hypothetical protein